MTLMSRKAGCVPNEYFVPNNSCVALSLLNSSNCLLDSGPIKAMKEPVNSLLSGSGHPVPDLNLMMVKFLDPVGGVNRIHFSPACSSTKVKKLATIGSTTLQVGVGGVVQLVKFKVCSP